MSTFIQSLWVAVIVTQVFSAQALRAGSVRLSADFSSTANPQGPWRLGYKPTLEGAFSLYQENYQGEAPGSVFAYWGRVSHSESFIRQNLGPEEPTVPGQGTFPLRGISATPGYNGNPDNHVCVRYAVRHSGTHRIWFAGTATGSSDVDVHLRSANAEVYGQNVDVNTAVAWTNEVTCVAGTYIDLAIGRGNDNSNYGAVFQFDLGVDSPADSGIPDAQIAFDPAEPEFTRSLSVDLVTSAAPGLGSIRYTLDGSNPSATSPVYTRALLLNQSTTVRAQVFGPDGTTSAVFSKSYRRVEGDPGTPGYSRFPEGLAAQFSPDTNAVNGWALGYRTYVDGEFIPYAVRFTGNAAASTLTYWGRQMNSESFIRRNQGPDEFTVAGQGTFPVGGLSATPGYPGNDDNYAVARFTIPSNGVYRLDVSGYASGLSDVDVHLAQDGVEIAGRNLLQPQSWNLNEERFYPKGTCLELSIGRGDDQSNFGAVFQFDAQVVAVATGDRPALETAFLPPRGHFTNEMPVRIVNLLGQGEIRYTLDGSEPAANSPLYTEPVRIDKSVRVAAAVFVDGILHSSVMNAAYHRISHGTDGIPWTWLEAYYGAEFWNDARANTDADPDADGSSNLKEYLAHSNPLDPLSGFEVKIKAAPSIQFASVPGQTYQILRRETPAGPAVEIGRITATGARTRFTDEALDTPEGFYTVEPVKP